MTSQELFLIESGVRKTFEDRREMTRDQLDTILLLCNEHRALTDVLVLCATGTSSHLYHAERVLRRIGFLSERQVGKDLDKLAKASSMDLSKSVVP